MIKKILKYCSEDILVCLQPIGLLLFVYFCAFLLKNNNPLLPIELLIVFVGGSFAAFLGIIFAVAIFFLSETKNIIYLLSKLIVVLLPAFLWILSYNGIIDPMAILYSDKPKSSQSDQKLDFASPYPTVSGFNKVN